MVQPHDEPILRFLTDVQVDISEDPWVPFLYKCSIISLLLKCIVTKISNVILRFQGFTLKFIFAPNPYFTNSVLTKEYEMVCSPDPTDPWSFEGPEIHKCKVTIV